MSNNINYNSDPESTSYLLKVKEMDLQSGVLGKFFGAPSHSPINIAGLIAILLVLTGIGSFLVVGVSETSELWKLLAPIITLAMGYIFGKQP